MSQIILADACPLCRGTQLDPRQGYAPRSTMLYLEEKVHPTVWIKLAQRLKELESSPRGAKIELRINVPGKGGLPVVEPDWDESYVARQEGA